jgi:O-antigen/teichoic acid export membrane protein
MNTMSMRTASRLIFLAAAICYGVASWIEYGPWALALGAVVAVGLIGLGRWQRHRRNRSLRGHS